MSETAGEDIRIGVEGSLAVITLDRPKALNALTAAMRAKIAEALPRFSRDPNVYAVVIQSASPKAFCAGSDVREIISLARRDLAAGRKAFRDEYALDWHCECFSKPTISLIDGAVMGGGVGISLYGTHRVAGEGYKFAMPETAIGLFPDVGVCHAFARMPGHAGTYLALTGRAIGRADAYALGLVTHCISAKHFEAIKADLSGAWPVDPVLDSRHEAPGAGEIEQLKPVIAACFGASSVEEIMGLLGKVEGRAKDWADGVLADLRRRSPLSLKITLKHIREAKSQDLRGTLAIDYRLGCRCLEAHDFYEGTRAVLIDKDGNPAWKPARIEDVTADMVAAYFAPLATGELDLPARTAMQEARA